MKILAAALVLSLAACAYLAFRLLDAGVSLDHSRMQAGMVRERAVLAMDLLNAGFVRRQEKDVEDVANRVAANRKAVVKRDGSALILGDIRFEFSNGEVKSVSFYGD